MRETLGETKGGPQRSEHRPIYLPDFFGCTVCL